MLQVGGTERAGAPEGMAVTDYERLHIHLSRAVAHVCPRAWSAGREDFVQECMLRILELARRGDGKRLSRTYLYRVAYSVLVDEIRRRRRRPESPLDAEAAGVAGGSRDPEATATGREIGRAILDCLSRLGRDRRHGVTLYLQGHSVAEAAGLLDWESKKVENLVYRGLADMRQCLAAKGVTP